MKQALRDIAALVARLGVGGIAFANGWHKLEEGLNATGADFLAQGAPAPRAWATVTMLAELIGGALLIAGLIVPVVGLLLFAESLAVFVVAPPLNPISLNELVLLGVAALLLAVVGAGRVSVDHMVVIRRRESAAASEFAADSEADQVIASLRDPDEPAPTGSGVPTRRGASPYATGGTTDGATGGTTGGVVAAEPAGRGAGERRTTDGTAVGVVSDENPGPDGPAPAGGPTGRAAAPGGRPGAARRGAASSDELADRMEDTAPHAVVDAEPVQGVDAGPAKGDEPVKGDEPAPSAAPGDTLVAGRRKPQPRTRRPASGG
ncbi:DoxX family protein [Nonomuraea indica]|uniref:DoxX family membrane protein n=1 Tax=Nonomuraea indica TaxID=1581193 RepID=A0ABW8A1W2_9ACTN